MKLKIESLPSGRKNMLTMQVTGFTREELSKLKSLRHEEAVRRLIDIIDERNDGIGSDWVCKSGVFGVWFDNEAAYLNVQKSCD